MLILLNILNFNTYEFPCITIIILLIYTQKKNILKKLGNALAYHLLFKIFLFFLCPHGNENSRLNLYLGPYFLILYIYIHIHTQFIISAGRTNPAQADPPYRSE